MNLVQSNFPMERIATDILGDLPETQSGSKYILVVSDYFSKWTESFAMPNMEAEPVATMIVEDVIARFGVPFYIHSYKQLPYVMMAYRSAENETTGFTPNYLMLCREVSTPLDIMYEIPAHVKTPSRNQWVWDLKGDAKAEALP